MSPDRLLLEPVQASGKVDQVRERLLQQTVTADADGYVAEVLAMIEYAARACTVREAQQAVEKDAVVVEL
jgi:hypothetical protein